MKTVKTERPAPTSANQVLANTREDHNWRREPADLTTTGGIQKAIKAQWHAIQALADYIDGVATGETDDNGKPIKTSTDEAPAVSPPVVQSDPVQPAFAA